MNVIESMYKCAVKEMRGDDAHLNHNFFNFSSRDVTLFD